MSIEMEKLLRQILTDPSCSKLGALLEQNQHLTSSQSPSQHNVQELQAFEVGTLYNSTEIMPTLIACYKAATGEMGLISKTVVLPRN